MLHNGLFRKMVESYGITKFQDLDEEDLEMEMPLVTGFEFCSGASFYEGWKEDIPNANDDQVPFANDDYYYYFLIENPDNAVDPIIVAVDHEEPDLPPETCYDLTAGKLLSILQPE